MRVLCYQFCLGHFSFPFLLPLNPVLNMHLDLRFPGKSGYFSTSPFLAPKNINRKTDLLQK